MLYVVILYLRELSLIHKGVPQGFDKYNIQYFLSIKLIFVLKLKYLKIICNFKVENKKN